MISIEFVGMKASLVHLVAPPGNMKPHCDLVISGRIKGNQLSGAKFKIPICGVTECSGLRPGIWATRLCTILTSHRRTRGHLFGAGDNDSPKLANFHDVFCQALEEVQQARGDLMSPDLEVREAYGMLRSLH